MSGLKNESLVVVGNITGAPKVAKAIRAALPQALVFAAQSKGFKASWADAVLPLPISVNDLKVRLPELLKKAPVTEPVAAQPTAAPVGAGFGILNATTNFYTFAHFKEVLFIEVKRARRYGFPLALAVMAFDPVEGKMNAKLQEQLMGGLAVAIRRSLRDTDYPVQFSDDRVLLLMPHTDLAGSLIVARRICERVAKASLSIDGNFIQPTISVGVGAGEPSREYNFSDLVRQAQEGLATAQSRGGNTVEFSEIATGVTTDARGVPVIPPLARPV